MAQQALDQHTQLVVLRRQFADLRIAPHRRRHRLAHHALQHGGLFGQRGQVDLHDGIMNDAAASPPAFSAPALFCVRPVLHQARSASGLPQPARTGRRLGTGARHSQPSNKAANCDAVSEIAPVRVIGQMK